MDQQRTPVTVSVRNLGGIDSREVAFDPGVTVLTGRNATNRTSLIRAISAALGGSDGELKGDADEGRVELAVDGETYTRRFERDGDAVRVSGDPYTDETGVVDAFGCLLSTSPARRAVERGDGDALRDVVMRPVDTEEIRSAIERRQREVRAAADRLDELERKAERLPDLRGRLDERREERDEVVEDIESVRATIDEFEADVDAAEAAEAVVDELTDARSEYESVRDQLETQRTALESLEDERETVAAALDEATAPEDELAAARSELERLRSRQRELETTVNNLVSIVEFNEELVDDAGNLPAETGTATGNGESAGTVDATANGEATEQGAATENGPAGSETGAVVDALDPATRAVECWTCGTRVEREAIDARIADLRDIVDEKRAERTERRAAIDDCRERVSALESTVEEHASLSDELADIDDEIARRESRVDDLEARAAELRGRIDDLEDRAAESEDLRDSELLERYRRLSELEYERGQLDEAIDSLEADVAAAERSRDERDELADEVAGHEAALSDLRGRIADLEREAVETFNDHMATLLDRLGYANVERVWIERKTATDGDAVAPESTFDLHVVRSTAEGSVYEDTVDHLSESERELIGLVVALAGYLVHDVHETVPFVCLDSLEAIDADRIAALVEYFAEFAPYLVVALLPEDAQALPSSHERIVMDGAVA